MSPRAGPGPPPLSCGFPGAVRPDGYGYRVHAPAAFTPVELATWGTIKALYR